MENNNQPQRYFGGKLDGFIDKQERDLEQKHLKAYIKGKTWFQHGYDYSSGTKQPNMFQVFEIWK